MIRLSRSLGLLSGSSLRQDRFIARAGRAEVAARLEVALISLRFLTLQDRGFRALQTRLESFSIPPSRNAETGPGSFGRRGLSAAAPD
jgi:hypothetical protein